MPKRGTDMRLEPRQSGLRITLLSGTVGTASYIIVKFSVTHNGVINTKQQKLNMQIGYPNISS